jgi:hypothetical protein
MQIKFKQEIYDIKKGDNLLSFIFKINPNVEQSQFCKKGECRKCYSIIMNTGSYSTIEVLACQTGIYSPTRIVALPKILSKK